VHALERVGIEGEARLLEPGSPAWASARCAYLARFPEAEFMTALGDFRFVAIDPLAGRHIAGFGAARDVSRQELLDVMSG
jgi:putative heme iron utilization protein